MIRKIAARPFSAGVQFARPIRAAGLHDAGEPSPSSRLGRHGHDGALEDDHVEGAVVEGEVLAVPDAIVDVEPAPLLRVLRCLDERRCEIHAGDVGPVLRGELGNRLIPQARSSAISSLAPEQVARSRAWMSVIVSVMFW